MKKLVWFIILALVLVGCQNNDIENTITNTAENTQNQTETQVVENEETEDNSVEEVTQEETQEEETEEEETEEEETQEEEEPVEEEPVEEVVDYEALYREYKVNEAGKVVVIMYHNLADKPGAYATTPDLFRQDLERLYEEGYRTVSMSDLVNNTIDIPIGTTPVVLTFDDGAKSNFYYDENGEIAKDCVVGILDDFYAEHEDFGRNAIFYLYGTNPFRQPELLEKKLEYLIDNGYEIGTHSYGHEDFESLNEAGLQKSLGRNEAFIDSVLEEHDMIHLSLPFGHRPAEAYRNYLWQGSYEDTSYNIVSAVNVGWNPIASPATSKFNPKSINRITCGDDHMELNYWLDDLKNNPGKRFYSDGDPSKVVVPESQLEAVDDKYIEQTITYTESEED